VRQGRDQASPPGSESAGRETSRAGAKREQILRNIRCDEEVIEEFFDQLWSIDSPPPQISRVSHPISIHSSTSTPDERLL